MGTWAAGNFDDDAALDWLSADVVSPLVETIQRELWDHDESNGTTIMAAVEVLCLLCENVHAAPPEPGDVETWRAKYLGTWNQYISELDPKEGFKEERFRVINATFDRLVAAAKKFWDHRAA